ncbi:hypothetical protein DAEQUDRAFT_344616 [Daedalea quercina L-15889]|uniref:Uncharacterized protein n=1 Tax=Daedalea quercina L-15889 TaxID=1314783 RepID=A0A165PH60_9APHY|nr:hypothetical protein DAEQUDRAFT_344616 [Daedalea quercina L-15889]
MTLFVTCLSLSLIYSLLALLPHSAAASTNTTIDDQYGDLTTGRLPVYSGSWNVGQDCSGCAVSPMPSKTYMGTWHDTTSNSPASSPAHTVALTFNGTAIWVYCILANFVGESITTSTNISFELDGAPAGVYTHEPDTSDDDYAYNVTVYSNTGLSHSEHTLIMTAAQGQSASLLLFDWAKYMFDDAEPVSSSASASSSIVSHSTSSQLQSSSTLSSSSSTSTSDALTTSTSTSQISTASSLKSFISVPSASPMASSMASSMTMSTASTPSATKTGAALNIQADFLLGSLVLLFSGWALM